MFLPSHRTPLYLIEPSALAVKLFLEKVTYQFHPCSGQLIESILINGKPFLTQKKRTKTWRFYNPEQEQEEGKQIKTSEPFLPIHLDFIYILLQQSPKEKITNANLIWKSKWIPKWVYKLWKLWAFEESIYYYYIAWIPEEVVKEIIELLILKNQSNVKNKIEK